MIIQEQQIATTESSLSLFLNSLLTSLGLVSMLSWSVLVQTGGGGARARAWATYGGGVVTSDSYSSMPVLTTSSSRIGVKGTL